MFLSATIQAVEEPLPSVFKKASLRTRIGSTYRPLLDN